VKTENEIKAWLESWLECDAKREYELGVTVGHIQALSQVLSEPELMRRSREKVTALIARFPR
jgi:hypothetical protein